MHTRAQPSSRIHSHLITIVCAVALAASVGRRPTQAQQPTDRPCIEAGSIKPQTAPGPVIGGVRAPDVFSRPDMTLRYLLVYAYALPDYRIVGGPPWIDSARVDVPVKTSSVPTAEQMRQLVRQFRDARFSLKTRLERPTSLASSTWSRVLETVFATGRSRRREVHVLESPGLE